MRKVLFVAFVIYAVLRGGGPPSTTELMFFVSILFAVLVHSIETDARKREAELTAIIRGQIDEALEKQMETFVWHLSRENQRI